MKTKNVSRDTIQKIRVEQISPNPNESGKLVICLLKTF